jgi:L,D-peptidoglycan transpeptidase YkuD (ErfK/YbiS/YcfS/YnhG family)
MAGHPRAVRLSALMVCGAICGTSLVACTTGGHRGAAAATAPAASSAAPASGSVTAASAAASSAVASSAVASSIAAQTAATSTPPPPSVTPAKTSAAATPTPTRPPPTPTSPPPPRAPLLVTQLADVGNAQQVVIVTSSSWSSTAATVQTFEKDAGGWHAVFAPMASLIGRHGFSANRTEGDGTTPTGKYSFGTMFGQQPSPGVKFPYRQPDAQSVWVDDNASPYYNSWQENAALSGEHLTSSGFARPYAYAAVINFNMSPVVPHKGSAIFLHVSTGNPTAGCVSVAQSNLLQILRWLDPARDPVIVMGPTSVIRTY